MNYSISQLTLKINRKLIGIIYKCQTMKPYILLSTLIFSFQTLGQDSTWNRSGRFFVGLNFSPDYNYRTLSKNSDDITEDQWNNAKHLEDSIFVPKVAYTTGISFGYQINRRISVESGVRFANKGYKTIPILTVYDWNSSPERATTIINFYYLDVPLRMNVTFFNRRIQAIASVGTDLNFLYKTTYVTIPETPTPSFPEQTHTSTYEYNRFNLSPTISIGVLYNVSNRFSVRLDPTFRYGLLNLDEASYKRTHLWNSGLNITFHYWI